MAGHAEGVFTVTREIGIDAGHRVPTHGSKCANLHGHRYRILAHCYSSELHTSGEQTDMGLDFGFLKDVMMTFIDEPCDHGMIMFIDDPMLEPLLKTDNLQHIRQQLDTGKKSIRVQGVRGTQTKLLVVPFIPTAECLARFWFEIMEGPVNQASKGLAQLAGVEVWETPNCKAEFFPRIHGAGGVV
jgi:6-pyruvoyltetrahydropterin/6-carboxytetrahydropterin synthase